MLNDNHYTIKDTTFRYTKVPQGQKNMSLSNIVRNLNTV